MLPWVNTLWSRACLNAMLVRHPDSPRLWSVRQIEADRFTFTPAVTYGEGCRQQRFHRLVWFLKHLPDRKRTDGQAMEFPLIDYAERFSYFRGEEPALLKGLVDQMHADGWDTADLVPQQQETAS